MCPEYVRVDNSPTEAGRSLIDLITKKNEYAETAAETSFLNRQVIPAIGQNLSRSLVWCPVSARLFAIFFNFIRIFRAYTFSIH